MYGLNKEEREEMDELTRFLTFSNGVLDKEKCEKHPEKGMRLKELTQKRILLMQASQN